MERALVLSEGHAMVWVRTHEHRPGSEVLRDLVCTHELDAYAFFCDLSQAEDHEAHAFVTILGVTVFTSTLAALWEASGMEWRVAATTQQMMHGFAVEPRTVRFGAALGALVVDDGDARFILMGAVLGPRESACTIEVDPIAPIAPTLSVVKGGA